MRILPRYVKKYMCKNKEIVHCNYFMHHACKNTCGYAQKLKHGNLEDDVDMGLVKLIERVSKMNKNGWRNKKLLTKNWRKNR